MNGGTFCRFTVGSSAPNASVRYLRYIANEQSVREPEQGTLLWNLPDRKAMSGSYQAFTATLAEHVKADAEWELSRHQSRGHARTHYRALLSFETDIGTSNANGLVAQWIAGAFPQARAASFLHRNTNHLHAHIWIAARLTNGKKIDLSARDFRQLDERWNRIYAHAFSRPEQEHLAKKWQTERHKQLAREGHEIAKPLRVSHSWKPEMFNQRERERLGAGRYERNESGAYSDQRPPSGNDSRFAAREQDASQRSHDLERVHHGADAANRASEFAVSEAVGLHEAAAQVAARWSEREREVDFPMERERER